MSKERLPPDLDNDDGESGHYHDGLDVQQRRFGGRPAAQALFVGAGGQPPVERARLARAAEVGHADRQADEAQDEKRNPPPLQAKRPPSTCKPLRCLKQLMTLLKSGASFRAARGELADCKHGNAHPLIAVRRPLWTSLKWLQ